MDILIAEDSPTSRKLLKKILLKLNFNVIETENGEDAWLELQKHNPPRIALIDWMMPKLDGIGLIKRIRESEKNDRMYTYLIMITSNSEEKDIKTGFVAGADDYITKPIDPQALSVRLKIGRRIIQQQNHLYDVQKKLANQLETQKEQIAKAQEIQQVLNTSKLPLSDIVNIQAIYNPSQEMGGDFFNIIKTVSNKIAIIMVDCTGHGLEASMYATLLKSVCDRHIPLLDKPQYLSSFVQMVNTDVASYITTDQFPVMFTSIFDPLEMKFYYSSANGEHPYLIRNGKVYQLLKARGMHLGYNTESQYQEKSFEVKDNDIVFFYSDAIIETEGLSWSRSNDEKLKEELSSMGKGLWIDNQNFMRLIHESTGSTTLNDDLSLIYFQVKKPYELKETIHRENEINRVKKHMKEQLLLFDYTINDIEQILITTSELLLNAIKHGNNLDDTKSVNIDYKITCKDFLLTVEDEGNGFDESRIPDPTDHNRLKTLLDEDKEESYTHGRGVWMVKKFMDKVTFSKGGRMASVSKNKTPTNTCNNYSVTTSNSRESI